MHLYFQWVRKISSRADIYLQTFLMFLAASIFWVLCNFTRNFRFKIWQSRMKGAIYKCLTNLTLGSIFLTVTTPVDAYTEIIPLNWNPKNQSSMATWLSKTEERFSLIKKKYFFCCFHPNNTECLSKLHQWYMDLYCNIVKTYSGNCCMITTFMRMFLRAKNAVQESRWTKDTCNELIYFYWISWLENIPLDNEMILKRRKHTKNSRFEKETTNWSAFPIN